MKANKEYESRKLMEKCPRFIRCNAPICPLDLLQDERTFIPGEAKCNLSRAKREALAAGTDLPRKGMTKAEWAAHCSWTSLNDTQRAYKMRHLTKYNPKTTANMKIKSKTHSRRPVNEKALQFRQ